MPKKIPTRARATIAKSSARHGLTSRESEVLFWVARGKANREIAAILGIASATVEKHLEHIYPKLGVENRTAAASFATECTEPDGMSHDVNEFARTIVKRKLGASSPKC